MQRPNIKDIQSGEELKRWYWLKAELVNYCKHISINHVGAKFDILERIANILDGRENPNTTQAISKQQRSKFDWHSETLTPDTVLTDSYKNSQNVRLFFKQHCGDKFHFSIPLMDFMKGNCGKQLSDAVNEWKRLRVQSQDKNFKREIPLSNQYNKYLRDFFTDNPNLTIAHARHFWKLKKGLPLSRHVYEKSDLKLQ